MRQLMRVNLVSPDETYDVEATSIDIRAWEAEHSESWWESGASYTKLAQLAFLASRRMGLFAGDFDRFNSRAVDAEAVDSPIHDRELIANPTRPEVMADS